MKDYKKVICRNLVAPYGQRVQWVSTDANDVKQLVKFCADYSEGFSDLLVFNPAAIICNMGNTQYEFIR